MNRKDMIDIFESNDYSVHTHKEDGKTYAEVETWTSGGVNMLHTLQPFTLEQFERVVEEFDVDEEIDLHRLDKRYRDVFTIQRSLNDFTEYHEKLKATLAELKERSGKAGGKR